MLLLDYKYITLESQPSQQLWSFDVVAEILIVINM